jgi:hypothetical protein
MRTIEFKATVNGKKVTVHSEIDGYKPLGVEAFDADGNEVNLTMKDEDRLYLQACDKVLDMYPLVSTR